jgi:hypothetical protein
MCRKKKASIVPEEQIERPAQMCVYLPGVVTTFSIQAPDAASYNISAIQITGIILQ